MVKNIIWTSIFIVMAGILQSSLIAPLCKPILKAFPDIALCILIFSAYQNGPMTGQLTGFFSGMFLDFLSAAPLGLNIFIRTLVGASCGLLRGTFFLDFIFLPMALCAGGTVFKAGVLFLLNFLLAGAVPAYSFTSPLLWIEVLLNAFCAPFVFALLKSLGSLLVTQKEG